MRGYIDKNGVKHYPNFQEEFTRRHNRKQSIINFVIFIALVLFFTYTISIGFEEASKREKEDYVASQLYDKMYFSYEIQSGDTVSELYGYVCEMHPETENYRMERWIEDVNYVNDLKGDSQITSSMHIILPYYELKK